MKNLLNDPVVTTMVKTITTILSGIVANKIVGIKLKKKKETEQ